MLHAYKAMRHHGGDSTKSSNMYQEIKADHHKGTPIELTADFPEAAVKATGRWISILKVLIKRKNCQPELCTHKHYLLKRRAK